MILVIHIFVALSSVATSTLAAIRPTRVKLNVTFGLTLATLATGTYLVWSLHSPLLASCMTGLIYIGVVMSGIVIATRRLVRQEVRSRD